MDGQNSSKVRVPTRTVVLVRPTILFWLFLDRVKHGAIISVLERRFPGRKHSFVVMCLPVKAFKPLVQLDITPATSHHAQPPSRVHRQQAFDKVLQRPVVHELGKREISLDDVGADLQVPQVLRGIERRKPDSHLVHQHTQRPHIDTSVVALAQQHLRRHILRGPAQSESPSRYNLRTTEITHLEVAISINQQVLGLQVSVDNVQISEILEARDHIGSVEPGFIVRQSVVQG
mmetsp:Transcript_13869/g.32193  ORF Transcript_13869/g.32193 Transcript_13869/m.32193 type:complete len:232 (-) Transcript_13869:2199-2894(-)